MQGWAASSSSASRGTCCSTATTQRETASHAERHSRLAVTQAHCFCGVSTVCVPPYRPSHGQHMRSAHPAPHCPSRTCDGLLQGLRAAIAAEGAAGRPDQCERKHLGRVVIGVGDVYEGRVVLRARSRRRGAAQPIDKMDRQWDPDCVSALQAPAAAAAADMRLLHGACCQRLGVKGASAPHRHRHSCAPCVSAPQPTCAVLVWTAPAGTAPGSHQSPAASRPCARLSASDWRARLAGGPGAAGAALRRCHRLLLLLPGTGSCCAPTRAPASSSWLRAAARRRDNRIR